MIKNILSFFISILLIFNNFLYAYANTTTDTNNSYGYYDVNNTMPSKPNVQCYFIFDKLGSSECYKLYNKYNGKITDMMNDKTFYKCLISNCGLYKTNAADFEKSYQYKMEIIKKCKLVNQDTLTFNELSKSDWFVNLNTNINKSARVSKKETQERFLPFKVLNYKCPKFVKIDYQKKQRVLQYPVLCFTTDNTSTNNDIEKCLDDGDKTACDNMRNETGGNLKKYIQYLYCEEDEDGDGYPEHLSPAQQKQCHRADAADLICKKDNMCSTTVTCDKYTTQNIETNSYNNCDPLTRNYKDYTLYTGCGDVEDIYAANPNCIRINSVTNARERGIEYIDKNATTNNLNKPLRFIEIKNYPSSNELLNSYQEYVLYKKKKESVNQKFVALIYPKAIYKEKSGYTFLGKLLNVLTGGMLAVAEGDAPLFSPIQAIGAGFVTKKDSIPPTVVDDVLRKAIENKNYITTNKDVKGITYKVKKEKKKFGLKVKYRMWFMKAWWNPSIVIKTNLAGNPKANDWVWSGYNRKDIKYYLKIGVNPNEVLVGYTINAKDNLVSTPETYYKQYGDVQCKAANNTPLYAEWKSFITPSKYKIKSPSIQNMSIFLNYPSLYLFKFYNDDKLVGMFLKNFPYNKGEYPLKDLNINGIIDNSDFAKIMHNLYVNKYKPLILNDTLNDYMNLAETQTLIDKLSLSLLKTFEKRNIDEILKREKKLTDYKNEIKDFLDFYSLNYALDYYIAHNKKNDDLCSDDLSTTPTPIKTTTPLDLSSDNTKNLFDENIKDYKTCLIGHKDVYQDILNKLNNDQSVLTLDKERLNVLMDNTKKVYYDFSTRIKNNVNSYLNKSSTRYYLSNNVGSWSMSFKSACGDYQEALNNAYSNYMDNIYDITNQYFMPNVRSIGNNLINLIKNHMQNITLRYKYSIYRRTGTSKWDSYHSARAGHYSCSYTGQCWNSCAYKYKCNCSYDAHGNEHCSSCCGGGYVPCTKTESGSCYTYGKAGSECQGQCGGYVNAHWGSQVNACGDSECDVSNDWDRQCNANYTYYETDDNGGNGFRRVDDNGINYFDSFGDYQCNVKTLRPTGNPNKYCQTSGHDLAHFNYKNTKVGTGYWSSTAKKLNVTTEKIETLENAWLRNTHYRDFSYINSLWDTDEKGYNSERVALSTSTSNGIYKVTDNYVLKHYITPYVTNYVKQYFLKKINYELDNSINQDSILEKNQNKYLDEQFNEAIDIFNSQHKKDFKPFNIVEINDLLADPKSPYSMNYTIDTPSGLLIKNPDSLNIVMLSYPEVRRYRCYTNWEKCDLAKKKNCTLDSFLNYNYVTDFTGKRVPTLRKEVYKCKKTVTKKVCSHFLSKKKCYNIHLGNTYVEFDDNDYSKDFGKAVGENLAFDQAISIFGARELQCQKGLFTDFSWLTDPNFLMQIANVAGGYFMNNTATGQALKSWLSGGNGASPLSSCAKVWTNCMTKSNSTVSTAVQTGTTSVFKCDSMTRGIEGCHAFAGVGALSKQLNLIMNNPFMKAVNNPLASLAINVAYQLAFNTFSHCNQCIDRKCAVSHKPKEAITLYKMTYGKNKAITGAKYGLGPGFIAYNQCFYKDTSCAKKFWGKCLRDKEEYCCYNTKIARILAGQIYEQLGFTYQKNGCSAIKITDLPKIDFTPCPDGTVPSPDNKCINYKELEDYINSKINWNLKGSFDMNKVIQAVMDEGTN